MKQVALFCLAVATFIGMVVSDNEQAGDPYAEYYKEFYEHHTANKPQEKQSIHRQAAANFDNAFSNITPETSVRIALTIGLCRHPFFVVKGYNIFLRRT